MSIFFPFHSSKSDMLHLVVALPPAKKSAKNLPRIGTQKTYLTIKISTKNDLHDNIQGYMKHLFA